MLVGLLVEGRKQGAVEERRGEGVERREEEKERAPPLVVLVVVGSARVVVGEGVDGDGELALLGPGAQDVGAAPAGLPPLADLRESAPPSSLVGLGAGDAEGAGRGVPAAEHEPRPSIGARDIKLV